MEILFKEGFSTEVTLGKRRGKASPVTGMLENLQRQSICHPRVKRLKNDSELIEERGGAHLCLHPVGTQGTVGDIGVLSHQMIFEH